MKGKKDLQQLAEEFNRNQEVSVYEANQLYGQIGRYRFLQFSEDAIQGAIDLKDPKRVVLEYPRAILHLLETNDPSFENAFIIGHGIGTIAGHYPEKSFKVAEINESVVELSRKFFNYSHDNVVIGDGRGILQNEEADAYDYIILDAFTKEGTPFHLTTLEFFKMTYNKLNPRGSMIMNLMGKVKNDPLLDAIHTTFSEVYPFSKAFVLPTEEATDIRNIIVMGSNKAIAFKPRAMAGFMEFQLGQGHILMDK